MKKILLFIGLFLLTMIFLVSCSESPYLLKESVDEIESIEIVSADNSLEFIVLKTLSEAEKEEFLVQFQEIQFHKYLGDPPGVHGRAIKINYRIGTYEMICYFSAEYVEDGEIQYRWRSCDEEKFDDLLDNFLK